MASHYFLAALLSLYCSTIVEAGLCNGCVNDPPAKCLLWPMSPFEVKLMSPFCEGKKLCYIYNDMSYRWTKCVGYCEKTETWPGNYGSGGDKKCHPKTCKCCLPTKIQKVAVCIVCCDHWACSSQQPVPLLSGILPGKGQGQGKIRDILNKTEVIERAKQEYQQGQTTNSPPTRRPFPWLQAGGGLTKVPPPSHILPGKPTCQRWLKKKVYEVPRACSCQSC